MALNFSTSEHPDISRGIDSRSTPNLIKDGYSEDLVNVNTNSEGFLEKRKGQQGYMGYIPLRVLSVEYNGEATNNIIFTLDGTINLSQTEPSPIIVYGKLSDTTMDGDFLSTADAHQYYATYQVDQPITLATGSGTITRTAVETGMNSNAMAVGLAYSTLVGTQNNSQFLPDDITVNETTYQVDIDYTNGTGATIDSYLYFKDKTEVVGTIYHEDFVASSSITITAPTHGLSNTNILVQVEELSGGEYSVIIPDSATINTTTGEVKVTLSSALTGRVILTAVDVSNKINGVVGPGVTKEVTISNPDAPFSFVGCYLEPTPGAALELVLPDSVVYDEASNEINITFVNGLATSANFEIYYESAQLVANAISVTGTVSTTGVDTDPQLTIWGISHDCIYNATATRGGHSNYIDSYKSTGDSRLLCGLGGNIFKAVQASELSSTVAPIYYINLRSRMTADTIAAPVFQTTGAAVPRSQGTIEADNIENNKVTISAATYNTGTGYVDYTLSFVNRAILDSTGTPTTLSSVISTTSDLEDYVTITGMGHSRLNGSFKILSVTDVDSDTVTVSIPNSNIESSDYDEVNSGGLAYITTNRVTFLAATSFEADDVISADSILSTDTITVKSSSGTSSVLDGVTRTIEFSAGLRLYGTRTSTVFPIRNNTVIPIVDYLVLGDMLNIAGIDRNPRIVDIDTVNSTITLDEEITLSDTGTNSVSIQPVGRWYTIEIPTSTGTLAPTTRVTHFDVGSYSDQDTIRSNVLNDSMYLTNNADEILKFDGTSIYRAGLYKWKPELFSSLDTGTASFNLDQIATTAADSVVASRSLRVATTVGLSAGDKIYYALDNKILTIDRVDDTDSDIYTVETFTTTGDSTIAKIQEYRYYFRLNMIDANNNIIASASTGSEDFRVQVTVDSQIQLKLVGMPVMDMYDYDRIEVQICRTKSNLQTPFYQIGTVSLSFDANDGYILFNDGIIDDALGEGDLDATVSALIGNELPILWDQPLRAKHITATSNRLALANVKGYPKLDISVRKLRDDASFTYTDLLQAHETRWLLRKDNTDTGTTTNMIDRVAYEFVNVSGAVSITPASDITNNAGASFTIDSVGHGLAVGDWVYLMHAAQGSNNYLMYAGWYQISSKNDDDFTCLYAHSSTYVPGANDVDSYITATAPADVPVPLSTDGNYNQKDSNSTSRPYGTIAMNRFANAINASMSMADKGISGQETFESWITASSGQELGSGRLILTQPTVSDESIELVLDSAHGTSYQVFINGINRAASAQVGATTDVFPSRVVISYENYPEIFDDPSGSGQSVVDVNSADGQEITGIIPFFAESAFGQSSKEGVLVVFKTQSIYLVDVSQATAGAVQIQKIDSQGLGCTFPYSVAPTRNGIAFANRSGVYRLNYDLTISYIGKMMEGFWVNSVNRDRTTTVTAHHYALERRYELSIPTDTFNSQVYVYDHTREGVDQEFGAWTRYTGFNATGWANLDNDAFFSTTNGQVLSVRRAGDTSDYRDDASAVDEMVILTKPFTFGSAGIRHKLRAIISHFKIVGNMLGTQLKSAINLSSNFTDAGDIKITESNSSSSFLSRKVVSVRSSASVQKFVYLQLKYVNSSKDENPILSGINFVVAPLNQRGIEQPGPTGNINS